MASVSPRAVGFRQGHLLDFASALMPQFRNRAPAWVTSIQSIFIFAVNLGELQSEHRPLFGEGQTHSARTTRSLAGARQPVLAIVLWSRERGAWPRRSLGRTECGCGAWLGLQTEGTRTGE